MRRATWHTSATRHPTPELAPRPAAPRSARARPPRERRSATSCGRTTPIRPAPATRAIRAAPLATSRRPASRQQRRPLPSGLALRRAEISRELTVAGRTQAPPQQHRQINTVKLSKRRAITLSGTHNKAAMIEHGASTKPIDTNPQKCDKRVGLLVGRAAVPSSLKPARPSGPATRNVSWACGTARRVPSHED